MNFEDWMLHQGLSESSMRKYVGAIQGPLSAWAIEYELLSGPLICMTSSAGLALYTVCKRGKHMSLDDRDWHREAHREREKQRKIDETRAKFSAFSRKYMGVKVGSSVKSGLIPMMIFWCAVMGLLYMLMTHYLKPKQAHVLANGDLVINRSQDGHFYTIGRVNGREARFMVDTGASLVTVSDEFAQKAFILGGVSTTFKTANGDRLGRVVDGVVVSIGPMVVTNIKVGVGLHTDNESEALLGQSFLSKFDITMGKNKMVLRSR
jgi:aspartyl protease family protein